MLTNTNALNSHFKQENIAQIQRYNNLAQERNEAYSQETPPNHASSELSDTRLLLVKGQSALARIST